MKFDQGTVHFKSRKYWYDEEVSSRKSNTVRVVTDDELAVIETSDYICIHEAHGERESEYKLIRAVYDMTADIASCGVIVPEGKRLIMVCW